MKFLLCLLFKFLVIFSLYPQDDKYFLSMEVIGKSSSKKMKLDNGVAFLLYENFGGFTDNFGNYGNTFCYGKIKTKEEVAVDFNITCEAINQDRDKWWGEFTRSKTEMEAGVGTAKIIDGTGIYKQLVNTKCFFSTKYFNESFFSLSKCKLSKAVFDKLKK